MENLNLLLVEDDIPSLEMMTEVFASLNADVRPVSDSEQGCQLGEQGEVRRYISGSGNAEDAWARPGEEGPHLVVE